MATAPAATTAITTEQPQQTQQTQQPAGREWLPEDLRSSPSLEKFKTPGDVAKSYLELEKMASGSVRIPKPDAKPEELREFHKKLGVPESPDKYEFKRPEMPEGLQYDEAMETSFRTLAHQAGLSPHQAQSLLDGYTAATAARAQESTQKMQEGVASLKQEWGGEWDKNVGLATRAVKELGGEELKTLLNETGMGNHPVLIKMFSRLGADMAEDTLVKGDGTEKTSEDESTIRQKIEAMYDAKHPYMDERADPKLRLTAQNDMFKLQTQLAALTGKDLTRQ